MREDVLEILKCPQCGRAGGLSVLASERTEHEIREGRLGCRECGFDTGIHAGVIDLLPPGKLREEVTREIDGWAGTHGTWFDMTGTQSNFWLDPNLNHETAGISSDEFVRRLPNYDKIGQIFHQREGYKIDSYRELMEMAALKGNERLLELGAARCWTARDLTRLGCRCVATDIVTARYIGLESSDVYFEEDPSLYWERIRCDMEEMPFTDGSFDIVLCNAVLHHSQDMPKVLREIWRLLSPGGRLLIVNEPDFGLVDKRRIKAAQEQEAETTGANENLYNHRDFIRNLRRVGFKTQFRPLMWLMRYYAWRTHLWLTERGFKKIGEMDWILKQMIAHEKLVRLVIGLGTMGIAEKPVAR